MDENASSTVEGLSEGESIGVKKLNGWHSHEEQSESREDLAQAHQALTTAYQSLKQRLHRTEAEKQGLERDLRSFTHQQNSMEAAASPKHTVNGPTHGELTNGLLRTVRSEHNMPAARHGSWGYVNDGLQGSYAQKCQLMEIQLAKVEEERAQAQSELKQVRTRLTELTLTQEHHRRNANDLQATQGTVKTLEQKLSEAEVQKTNLRTRVDELIRERDEVVRDNAGLQQRCSSFEKQLAQRSPSQGGFVKTVAKDDDVETQTQVQAVTVMALQAVSEQQRVKKLLQAQQDVIRALQAKLVSSGHGAGARRESTQHPADRMRAGTLICQAQDDSPSAHGDPFGDFYMINPTHKIAVGERKSPQTPGHTPVQTPGHTPKHTPIHTPKQPSSRTSTPTQKANFAFDPIGTYSEFGDAANERLPMPHAAPLREDYFANIALDINNDEVQSPRSPGDHDSAFSMVEDERTMTRIHSEDITINLDPDNTRAADSSQFNDVPPPSPCRRGLGGGSPRGNSPRRDSPLASQGRILGVSHGNTPMEGVETSTTSSDEGPVRRPSAGMNGGSNPQPNRFVRPSDSPFSTGVHGSYAPLGATAHAFPEVQPTANTETGSPAVRSKQSNLLQDRRNDLSNIANPTGMPRRGATMPTSTELRIKPDENNLSQSLPRQRVQNRNTWSPGSMETPHNMHGSNIGLRMTTVYDGPPLGGRTEGGEGSRREGGGKPPPVENEEWESGGGIRGGALGRHDSGVNQCIICNVPFRPGTSVQDKERHVNECLTQSVNQPRQLECPVCKNIFPIDFSQKKFELHVHDHFGDLPADRYEIIDAGSLA